MRRIYAETGNIRRTDIITDGTRPEGNNTRRVRPHHLKPETASWFVSMEHERILSIGCSGRGQSVLKSIRGNSMHFNFRDGDAFAGSGVASEDDFDDFSVGEEEESLIYWFFNHKVT